MSTDRQISVGLVMHNHQPVGQTDQVFEEIYEQAYEPMIAALERHPGVCLGLHYTGSLLDWLVEHHDLRATDAEVEQRIAELAARRGTPVAELRASLEKAKRLRDLERGLTEEKVFTFLLSQSTVEQT